MTWGIRDLHLILIGLIVWLGTAISAQAGTLGDIEDAAANRDREQAARQAKKSVVTDTNTPKHRRGALEWFLDEIVFDQTGNANTQTGASAPRPMDDDRVYPPDPAGPSVMPPSLQFDTNYQYVDAHTYAVDKRLELGHRFFGFDYRITHYRESNPLSELRITRYNALMRLQFDEVLRIDLGAGQVVMDGAARNSGYAWTASMAIYPPIWQHLGVELRTAPTYINGNDMDDYEFALVFRGRHLMVRGGYRNIGINNIQLGGPYAGLGLRF